MRCNGLTLSLFSIRGAGPLNGTMGLISTAKEIAEAANAFDGLVHSVADQVNNEFRDVLDAQHPSTTNPSTSQCSPLLPPSPQEAWLLIHYIVNWHCKSHTVLSG